MRKYSPEAYIEYEPYDPSPYARVSMVESEYGQWVPIENAQNAIKQLTKQVERLKLQLLKLQTGS